VVELAISALKDASIKVSRALAAAQNASEELEEQKRDAEAQLVASKSREEQLHERLEATLDGAAGDVTAAAAARSSA